ncbi:caspase domain-containing protein [Amylostereum chailletii]|nr:caspase domain-containing protein [Amylostereum chailletii]
MRQLHPGAYLLQVIRRSYTDAWHSPPLYALIVGIDKYAFGGIPTLYGAVADAEAIANYVKTQLQVPEDHIIRLHDAGATRAAIINAFRFMAGEIKHRDSIPNAFKFKAEPQKDDPILIYYAGHGSTALRPRSWTMENEEIQLIVPYDCTKENSRSVDAIPDRTLNALLQKLAEAKGDNITVIFDCCHSGSGTRELGLARGFTLKDPPPENIDADILKLVARGRGANVPTKFAYAGLSSHVLLAACSPNEIAMERNGRGMFTTALLKSLESSRNVTYKDLIRDLGVLKPGPQNPQCEGKNGDRVIFTKYVPNQRRPRYRIREKKGIYTLDAGEVQGIVAGDEFDIHTSAEDSKETFTGKMKATTVEASRTVLGPLPDATAFTIGSSSAFAFESRLSAKWASFRLRITSDGTIEGNLKATHDALQKLNSRPRDLRWERVLEITGEVADVEINFKDGQVGFLVSDSTKALHLPSRYHSAPPNVDFQHIRDVVLHGVAHYYWHLNRPDRLHDVKNLRPFKGAVSIEFTKLKDSGVLDDEFKSILVPDGPGITPTKGRIDVTADSKTPYGITLTSTAKYPLYAYVFYFNCSNLSITSCYEPPTSRSGGTARGPLRPGCPLTIGYGSEGADPYVYSLDPGQQIDVGFLKIFLSQSQVDLSWIPQPSPFVTARVVRSDVKPSVQDAWDTVKITVVQNASGSQT